MSTETCETCGTKLIDRCYNCGAPICCPRCCREAAEELKQHLRRHEFNEEMRRDALGDPH